jgi:rSAM/selenodomain-associated transferase 2/rSAM/selenodomain-associated transferase 1
MPDEPLVSVVIPVWRDEEALSRALDHVGASPRVEVIVAGVLGEEPRYQRHRYDHPTIGWVSAPRGRAVQMNAGAGLARGRWLLFLHADSELPEDWLRVVFDADRREGVVAGAFRLAIDSRAWQARLIEAAVRLRVALLGMPYGDQALFVRRPVFDELGGFADLPLMEDLDFVRRLKKVGPRMDARSPVRTSARRWERDGWWRRSAQNLCLAAAFQMGASPRRLARAYTRRKPNAIVMMARAPWTGGKTRLGIVADDVAHAELRQALFLDTLAVVTSVGGADHLVACEPTDACERLRGLVGDGVEVIAQRGGDLGERISNAFEDAFRLGFESVVVIGSDLPDLPGRTVEDALASLERDADQVVLGPATDGGYYLVGMNRPYGALFRNIDWGRSRVLDQTLNEAAAAGLRVTLLETAPDIDEPADLQRLLDRPNSQGASRTRAWISAHMSAASTPTSLDAPI